MTQERFIQFLENPDALSSISYEEMKTLALAYPYAHNLRYLLALKSQQIHHPDEARNLAAAAAHSLDRTRLFAWIIMPQLAAHRVLEEVLELKPIESIRQKLEILSPVAKEQETEKQAFVAVPPPPESLGTVPASPIREELQASYTAPPPPPVTVPVYQSFSSWIGDFQPPILATESQHGSEPPPPPSRPSQRDSPPPMRSVAQELAERSVAENQEVISETLARLLAKQGHRDKAVAMYERLGLAFPDKSGFFAAEIDKLKK